MKKFAIGITILLGVMGLIGIILFFMSFPDQDGQVYLWSLIPLAYSILLLVQLIKNKEFDKTHKLTLNLLIWPSLISLILSIILAVGNIMMGEVLGVWFAIIILLIGLVLASLLSIIGFIIDSIKSN